MSFQRRLPRVLLLESLLAIGGILGGVVPFVLTSSTSLRFPTWLSPVGWLAVAALVALWVLLLGHALADVWRLWTEGVGLTCADRRGIVHSGFRTLESLSVVLPPVLVFWFGRSFSRSAPPAPAAVGALFIVVGSLVIGGVVVILHAGWMIAANGQSASVH